MIEVLRRSLPKRILRRLARHPIPVAHAVNLALKTGRDAHRWHTGLIDVIELRRRLGSHVGTMGGGLAGAAAGAALFNPGVAAIVGAFAGSMVGESLGHKAGRAVVEQAEDMWSDGGHDEP